MKPWDMPPLEMVRSGHRDDYAAYLYPGPGDEYHVACIPGDAPGGRDAWAMLFQAAPKMARALLVQGYRHDGKWHTAVCHEYSSKGCSEDCVGARDALTAAGVSIDDP